jgi:hypothetical protein
MEGCLAGVLARVLGVLGRVPGVLDRVPGALERVPGALARVPGALERVPERCLKGCRTECTAQNALPFSQNSDKE